MHNYQNDGYAACKKFVIGEETTADDVVDEENEGEKLVIGEEDNDDEVENEEKEINAQ